MKSRGTWLSYLALAVCAGALGGPVRAQGVPKVTSLSVGKGTDAKSRAEAAELSYLSDAAKGSSYGIQGALIWAPQALFDAGAVNTSQWDLAVGLNKNTIVGDKRVDKLSTALGGRTVLDIGSSHLLGRASLERRRNRLTDGDETALSVAAILDAWKWSGSLPGGLGYDFKPFPVLGVYRADISGNTGPKALNGKYGAPFAGFDLSVGLFKEDIKGRWFAIDVSYRRQFERWVSGDFRKANYDYASIAFAMPFSTGGTGDGTLSLGHVRGTDRLSGEPWKRQTQLKVTFKFGSA